MNLAPSFLVSATSAALFPFGIFLFSFVVSSYLCPYAHRKTPSVPCLSFPGGEKSRLIPRNFPGVPVARTGAPNAGVPGSIPGKRTRSHVVQLNVCAATKDSECQSKDPECPKLRPHAATPPQKKGTDSKNEHFLLIHLKCFLPEAKSLLGQRERERVKRD